ncbi:hypothetical protein H0H92_002748 [Tricholoma furcatifolium]|nr:hypothetical protein H0H92_002748 [Tricholoma furcatifolium]
MAKSEQVFCKLHNKMEPRCTELRHQIGGSTPYANRAKALKNPFDLDVDSLRKPQQEVHTETPSVTSQDIDFPAPPRLSPHNELLDIISEPLYDHSHLDIELPSVGNPRAPLPPQSRSAYVDNDSDTDLDDDDQNVKNGDENKEDLTWDDLEIESDDEDDENRSGLDEELEHELTAIADELTDEDFTILWAFALKTDKHLTRKTFNKL